MTIVERLKSFLAQDLRRARFLSLPHSASEFDFILYLLHRNRGYLTRSTFHYLGHLIEIIGLAFVAGPHAILFLNGFFTVHLLLSKSTKGVMTSMRWAAFDQEHLRLNPILIGISILGLIGFSAIFGAAYLDNMSLAWPIVILCLLRVFDEMLGLICFRKVSRIGLQQRVFISPWLNYVCFSLIVLSVLLSFAVENLAVRFYLIAVTAGLTRLLEQIYVYICSASADRQNAPASISQNWPERKMHFRDWEVVIAGIAEAVGPLFVILFSFKGERVAGFVMAIWILRCLILKFTDRTFRSLQIDFLRSHERRLWWTLEVLFRRSLKFALFSTSITCIFISFSVLLHGGWKVVAEVLWLFMSVGSTTLFSALTVNRPQLSVVKIWLFFKIPFILTLLVCNHHFQLGFDPVLILALTDAALCFLMAQYLRRFRIGREAENNASNQHHQSLQSTHLLFPRHFFSIFAIWKKVSYAGDLPERFHLIQLDRKLKSEASHQKILRELLATLSEHELPLILTSQKILIWHLSEPDPYEFKKRIWLKFGEMIRSVDYQDISLKNSLITKEREMSPVPCLATNRLELLSYLHVMGLRSGVHGNWFIFSSDGNWISHDGPAPAKMQRQLSIWSLKALEETVLIPDHADPRHADFSHYVLRPFGQTLAIFVSEQFTPAHFVHFDRLRNDLIWNEWLPYPEAVSPLRFSVIAHFLTKLSKNINVQFEVTDTPSSHQVILRTNEGNKSERYLIAKKLSLRVVA